MGYFNVICKTGLFPNKEKKRIFALKTTTAPNHLKIDTALTWVPCNTQKYAENDGLTNTQGFFDLLVR